MSKDVLGVPNSSGGSGNTIEPPKKQIAPSKRWCFTFNNYSQCDIDSIVPVFESECKCGLFGKEEGKLGTPHLQGYVEFLTKVRPKNMFSSKIHWEKAKGSRVDNIVYCSKEGHIIWSKGSCIPERPIKLIEPTKWWQKSILNMLEFEPDDRTINWFWSEEGNLGKTQFQKYLTVKHGAIALGWNRDSDVKNGIFQYKEKNGRCPGIICINIPRTIGADFVSYSALESIKDMYFFSGKYESGMICGPCPHLFVFANCYPLTEKLSLDRWRITNVDERGQDDIESYFESKSVNNIVLDITG